jgi:hypothetical protein
MLPVALASALRSANRSSAAALSSVLARRFALIASQSPSVFGSTTEALRARRSNATFASAPPHQWAAAPARRAWSIEELARLEESVNQQPDNAAVQVMFYKVCPCLFLAHSLHSSFCLWLLGC